MLFGASWNVELKAEVAAAVPAVEDSDDEAAEAGGTMKAKLQKGPLRVFPQGSSLRTTAYAIHV